MKRLACSVLMGAVALMALPVQAVVALPAYYKYSYLHGTLTDLSADQVVQGVPGNIYVLPTVYGDGSSAQSWTSVGVDDSQVKALTQNGEHKYSYSGEAQVDAGFGLHAKVQTLTSDASRSSTTTLFANASAGWGDRWYVAPTADHLENSAGLLNLHLSLDGQLLSDRLSGSTHPYNNFASLVALAYRLTNTGVAWQGAGGVYLDGQTAWQFSSPSWHDWNPPITAKPVAPFAGAGAVEVEVLMPFLYGQAFYLELQLNLLGQGNSTLDFGHTGKLTAVEMLQGTSLETGYASENPNAPALFTQLQTNNPVLNPVPEPASALLLLLGIPVLWAGLKRRHE
ncbi:PEP-CTERM sorting domain-containing protein [Paucibacter sp. TC2R-5]|uniref:PEP-CTERM sorting domain-containing protein n=1 Tax=Paucibacter sp. TC2R-5 TaxID=2893555 RepID=UPI0021E48397|nr:PEP-CTERM sorting domain-containing protein [Paucibacter sp. TC2R-5]MCV2360508.1 PEP-CTERM sorting domain-containing protein [Paucibacter sp. TC2R-5]